MGWRLIVALLFAVVVSLFAIQNAAVVSVNFLTAELQISQALVILLSVIIGAIMAMLFSVVRWIKTTNKLAHLNKTVSRLEKENQALTDKATQLTQQLEEQQVKISEQIVLEQPTDTI